MTALFSDPCVCVGCRGSLTGEGRGLQCRLRGCCCLYVSPSGDPKQTCDSQAIMAVLFFFFLIQTHLEEPKLLTKHISKVVVISVNAWLPK